jgi:hypothetical protein
MIPEASELRCRALQRSEAMRVEVTAGKCAESRQEHPTHSVPYEGIPAHG